jgi:hypothetical protein
MATKSCDACGARVLYDGDVCPRCGKRFPRRWGYLGGFLGFLGLVVLAVASFHRFGTGAQVARATDEEVQIRVTGTTGLPFSGSWSSTASDGKVERRSANDVVPATYWTSGRNISASFQKKVDRGTLRIEIVARGQALEDVETHSAYGVVFATTE